MLHLKLHSNSLDGDFIGKAAESLRQGNIIIFPTDTIYALGCDALNAKAIGNLCKVKDLNPDKNLLSIICSDLSQASEYARIDNRAFQILKEYLPGPFTFILPTSGKLPKVFKGRKTVGLRIPGCAIVRNLAMELGNPVLATSVQPQNGDTDYLTEPGLMSEKYNNIASLILDNGIGECTPSTIVDLTDSYDPKVIREGKESFQ